MASECLWLSRFRAMRLGMFRLLTSRRHHRQPFKHPNLSRQLLVLFTATLLAVNFPIRRTPLHCRTSSQLDMGPPNLPVVSVASSRRPTSRSPQTPSHPSHSNIVTTNNTSSQTRRRPYESGDLQASGVSVGRDARSSNNVFQSLFQDHRGS